MQSDQLTTQGSDTVEILKNDHQVIKQLLNSLTQATQIQQRKTILDQLKAVLTVHNATEENLVYPALQSVADEKRQSQKLYHETAEADVVVFDLDTMLKEGDDSDFAAAAKKLQAAVLEHIDDEENSAFPRLQKNADTRQTQMLTESVREFRSKFRFSPMGTSRTETGDV